MLYFSRIQIAGGGISQGGFRSMCPAEAGHRHAPAGQMVRTGRPFQSNATTGRIRKAFKSALITRPYPHSIGEFVGGRS